MKSSVAALNLGEDLISRLDSVAAADGRSRSNAARFFLEAALNADAALRQQAAVHFAKIQTPGCHDSHGAAGGVPDASAGSLQVERPAGSRSELCPGAAVDGAPSRDGEPPAAPFIPVSNGKTMQVTDPHAQLKADALRTATNGILARLYPQKPIKAEKENTK
jgi:plasmid stability protein